MRIDDVPGRPGGSVGFWREVLHDVVDEVFDRALEAARDEHRPRDGLPGSATDDGGGGA